jgi:hypothetical protein
MKRPNRRACLKQKWVPGLFLGVKGPQRLTSPPSVSRLSRKCGSLDVSETFWPSMACYRDSFTFSWACTPSGCAQCLRRFRATRYFHLQGQSPKMQATRFRNINTVHIQTVQRPRSRINCFYQDNHEMYQILLATSSKRRCEVTMACCSVWWLLWYVSSLTADCCPDSEDAWWS